MPFHKAILTATVVATLLAARPAAAQLTPPEPDPLARIRAAAAANTEACSTQEISACAQAAPKIIAATQSSPALAANLRYLTGDIGARVTGSPQMARAVAWAVTAFHEAGVDDVRVEKFSGPAAAIESSGENVVAEIRGREKPDEFVLLGAHLDSWNAGTGALDAGCNAALVIEAARAIHLTGLRPRRSIRFVLFSGSEQGGLGSWSYARAHRPELDRAAAAVFFDRGCGRVTGFSLGGRSEIESGVREALAFFNSGEAFRHTPAASAEGDQLDFLLQGVPTLLANQEDAGYAAHRRSSSDTLDKVNLENLRLNTAVAAVLAFGLAEAAAPLGRRLSRADMEVLLNQTGLAAQMNSAGIWRLWLSGERGRQP